MSIQKMFLSMSLWDHITTNFTFFKISRTMYKMQMNI
uniref:Uncharacterized protein MANES_18G057500 n=1 Tax=Rhizophora mucronata TaxID=61149 RepID=A0A2P2KYD1_RHIMU